MLAGLLTEGAGRGTEGVGKRSQLGWWSRGRIWVYIGIMEKKMETTIYFQYWNDTGVIEDSSQGFSTLMAESDASDNTTISAGRNANVILWI